MNAIQNQVAAGTTVFVVDDEPELLNLAAAILEPMGCLVKTYRDPELALKEFAILPPKVVVTDYAMGRMSGMDLIRECRRLHPHQKILLVSGTVDGQMFAEAPVKPDCFLTKPYQIQDLVDCVRGLIAS